MTSNEAMQIIQSAKSVFFVDFDTDKNYDASEYDFKPLFSYLESLDVPFEVAKRFVSGEIKFLNGDEFDYVIFYSHPYRVAVWTEIAGNIYFLDEYNKKWKDNPISYNKYGMTKTLFVDLISFIKKQNEKQDKLCQTLEECAPGCYCDAFIYSEYETKIIDTIVSIMKLSEENESKIYDYLFCSSDCKIKNEIELWREITK